MSTSSRPDSSGPGDVESTGNPVLTSTGGTSQAGSASSGTADPSDSSSGGGEPETVVPATSCALADVRAAVEAAPLEPNVVVEVPAGSCDWGAEGLVVTRSLRLRGAGSGATLLRHVTATNNAMITFDCSKAAVVVEVSDIALEGIGDETTIDRGVALTYGCQDFLVRHAEFRGFGHAGVEVTDNLEDDRFSRGVIYESAFLDNFVPGYGYGVVVIGDGTWRDFVLGSPEAVFVEDCEFTANRHAIASNGGSVYSIAA